MPPTDDIKQSLAKAFLGWFADALKQHGVFFLLFSGLLALHGWLVYTGLRDFVPSAIAQVQAGYERIEVMQTRQLDSLNASFERRHQDMISAFREFKSSVAKPAKTREGD